MTDASYAGDVSVQQAYELLQSEAGAVLIDVRTAPEWEFVSRPDLRGLGKPTVLVQWQTWPDGQPNPDFVSEVGNAGVPQGVPVLVICRSGVRSQAAAIALTGAGFGPCYNVAGGFEGPKDADGHRGNTDGWKVAGLPWVQG